MNFQIKNRFTGDVQFECELDAEYENESYGFKLGLAVKIAIKKEANLSSADLSSVNLSSADLSSVNLSSADLSSANLRSVNLSYANLRSVNLSYADLRSADLSSVNLSSADLRSADLSSVNLSSADLRSANLSSVNLSSADLRSANLSSVNLSSANLRSANLRSADLKETKYTDKITIERAPLFIQGLNWDITILDEHMKIGCELHLIKDWAEYDNQRILEMDGKTALKFWKANKEGLITIAHGDKRGLK